MVAEAIFWRSSSGKPQSDMGFTGWLDLDGFHGLVSPTSSLGMFEKTEGVKHLLVVQKLPVFGVFGIFFKRC